MTAHHLLSWHAATYASCSPWLFSFDQQPITSKSTTYRNISFPSYLLPSLSQLPLRPELIPSYLPPLSTSGTKYLSHPPPVHHVPIQGPRRGNRLSRRGYPHLPSATAERRNPALGGDDPCRQAKPHRRPLLSRNTPAAPSQLPRSQSTNLPPFQRCSLRGVLRHRLLCPAGPRGQVSQRGEHLQVSEALLVRFECCLYYQSGRTRER